jgi:hypothetical protein
MHSDGFDPSGAIADDVLSAPLKIWLNQ